MVRSVLLPPAAGIFLVVTTVAPSEAALCKKANGTVVVRSACNGKLVPVSAEDLSGLKGDQGPQGVEGRQGPQGPAGEPPTLGQPVSAHVSNTTGQRATLPLYIVPAGNSFVLTDVAAIAHEFVELSDSSGTRLSVSSENASPGFFQGLSHTYVSGPVFGPGEVISVTIGSFDDVTIMGRLLRVS
jgi:hypothetical protein